LPPSRTKRSIIQVHNYPPNLCWHAVLGPIPCLKWASLFSIASSGHQLFLSFYYCFCFCLCFRFVIALSGLFLFVFPDKGRPLLAIYGPKSTTSTLATIRYQILDSGRWLMGIGFCFTAFMALAYHHVCRGLRVAMSWASLHYSSYPEFTLSAGVLSDIQCTWRCIGTLLWFS
jgi:hypothetical protein